MSFNDMLREASRLHLIKSNLEKWKIFREMRNLTSHTYDENIALKIVSVIPDFYEEISYLINRIEMFKSNG